MDLNKMPIITENTLCYIIKRGCEKLPGSMISRRIDESEELLILCSFSTKSLFSFWDLRFLVKWGKENTISDFVY